MDITIDNLPALKKAYKQAVKENKEIFIYKGAEVVTAYAKYLIEYMESLTPKS